MITTISQLFMLKASNMTKKLTACFFFYLSIFFNITFWYVCLPEGPSYIFCLQKFSGGNPGGEINDWALLLSSYYRKNPGIIFWKWHKQIITFLDIENVLYFKWKLVRYLIDLIHKIVSIWFNSWNESDIDIWSMKKWKMICKVLL